MKKKLLCLIMLIFLLTGCFKRDDMEDIKIYTTLYPVHYLIDSLYGDNSDIFSVYPSGIDIDNYEFTSKQLNEYSHSGLFVFNSKRDTERDLAVDLINKNKNLKIIDSALGVNYTYSTEELWLNPYNYLMMAQNVKTGLEEYITNPYLIKEVDENYQSLKISLSELDAELKEIETVLPECIKMLNKGGRIVVVTFHSLEDRIVKQIFKKYSETLEILKGLPEIPDEYKPLIKLINKKPILPSEEELRENSRSSSAKLRIVERI